MKKNLVRQGIVLGIIFLFIGASVAPIIGSDTSNIEDSNLITEKKENGIVGSDIPYKKNSSPDIIFIQDKISNSLMVASAEYNLDWSNIGYWDGGSYSTVPGHSYGTIHAGDQIKDVYGTIELRWIPTDSLIGSWSFGDSETKLTNINTIRNSNTRIVPEWTYSDGGNIISTAVSASGSYIVVKTSYNIHLFHKDSGTPIWSKSTGNNMGYVSISSDESYIAASAYNQLRFYNLAGSLQWSYSITGFINTLSMSSDGEYIVAGGYDSGKIYLWDKDSSTPLWTYTTGGEVWSVDISSDGNYIVAGCYYDHKLYFFHRSSSTPQWYHTSNAYYSSESVTISSNGDYICAGDTNGDICLFEDDSNIPIWTYSAGTWIRGMDISSDGNYIAAGSGNTNLYFFQKDNSIPQWTYTGATDYYEEICISSDGNYIAGGCWASDKHVYFFSKNSNNPIWSYQTGLNLWTVSISSNGEYVAAGGNDGNLYFFFNDFLPPIVDIIFPLEGDTVSHTTIILGTAYDIGNVDLVEIKIDEGSWETATGTTSWSYSWDTTTVQDGQHTIHARSYDGQQYSEIDFVNVNVDNSGYQFISSTEKELIHLWMISYSIGNKIKSLDHVMDNHNGEKFRAIYEDLANYVGFEDPLPSIDGSTSNDNSQIKDAWTIWLNGLSGEISNIQDSKVKDIFMDFVIFTQSVLDVFALNYDPNNMDLEEISIDYFAPFDPLTSEFDEIDGIIGFTFTYGTTGEETYQISEVRGNFGLLHLLTLLCMDILYVNPNHLNSGVDIVLNSELEYNISGGLIQAESVVSSLDITFEDMTNRLSEMLDSLRIDITMTFSAVSASLSLSIIAKFASYVLVVIAAAGIILSVNGIVSELTNPDPNYVVLGYSVITFIASTGAFALGLMSIAYSAGILGSGFEWAVGASTFWGGIGIALAVLITIGLIWHYRWTIITEQIKYNQAWTRLKSKLSEYLTTLLDIQRNLENAYSGITPQMTFFSKIADVSGRLAENGSGIHNYNAYPMKQAFQDLSKATEFVGENITKAIASIDDVVYAVTTPSWDTGSPPTNFRLVGFKSADLTIPGNLYNGIGQQCIKSPIIFEESGNFGVLHHEIDYSDGGTKNESLYFDENLSGEIYSQPFQPEFHSRFNRFAPADVLKYPKNWWSETDPFYVLYNETLTSGGGNGCFNSGQHTDIDPLSMYKEGEKDGGSKPLNRYDESNEPFNNYEVYADQTTDTNDFWYYKIFDDSDDAIYLTGYSPYWPYGGLLQNGDPTPFIRGWLSEISDYANITTSYLKNITFSKEYISDTIRIFSSPSIHNGIIWLRDNQMDNGSWDDDVGITSLAVLSMLNNGYSESDHTVSNAIEYIQNHKKYEGPGEISIYSDRNIAVQQTSQALLALQATHNPYYADEIEQIKKWLVSMQNDADPNHWSYGGWTEISGGYDAGSRESHLDIAVVNRDDEDIITILGDGLGNFEYHGKYLVGNDLVEIVTGDFDNDTILDLAGINYLGEDISVFYGDGIGGFNSSVKFNVGYSASDITVGDFNEDGMLDLAVTLLEYSEVQVLLGDGYGGFDKYKPFHLECYPWQISTNDFNNDSISDLAIASFLNESEQGGIINVLLGDGNGDFVSCYNYSIDHYIVDIVSGDFNNDGIVDIAAVAENITDTIESYVFALLGDGSGNFINQSTYGSFTWEPIDLVAGNFNGDTCLDLAVSFMLENGDDIVCIILGDCNGHFFQHIPHIVGDYIENIVTGDFNEDGMLDLAVTRDNGNQKGYVSILISLGTGYFEPPVDYQVGVYPFCLAVGDFNSGVYSPIPNPGPYANLTTSQWAMMAIYAAGGTNTNNDDVWTKAEVFISRCQARDESNDQPWADGLSSGGFIYNANGDTQYGGLQTGYGSMTGAGILSLRLAGVSSTDPRIEKNPERSSNGGIEWIEDNYTLEENPGGPGSSALYSYYYNLANALVMTDKIHLNVDDVAKYWKLDMYDNITKRQDTDGYWQGTSAGGEDVKELATSYALLALETRTLPLFMNLWMSFTVASHSDLHIYDNYGRHTGKVYNNSRGWNGEIESEIPGSSYELINGTQIVNLSRLEAGNYRVELLGTSSGEYNLTIVGKQNDLAIHNETWTGNISSDKMHATDAVVTSMYGPLTILSSNLSQQASLSVEPGVLEFYAEPGTTNGSTFNVTSFYDDSDGVNIYTEDLINNENDRIGGGNVSYSPNDFTILENETTSVNMTLTVPVNIVPGDNATYTGRIIIDALNSGTRYIDIILHVVDLTPPEIIDNTPSNATTGDSFTFNATVTDLGVISGVYVYYRYGAGTIIGTPLVNVASNYWEHTIVVNHTLETLRYSLYVWDESWNINTTEYANITIYDNDNPTFYDSSPNIGTTGDTFTFDIVASDNIGVGAVNVTWSHGTLGGTNVSLHDDGDGTWSLDILLDHTLGDMTYIITVFDTSNNFVSGSQQAVTISDNDIPAISGVQADPPVQIEGEYVNISATVIDNVEVDEVHLYIEYPDSNFENFSITQNKTGDTYYCNKTYGQVGIYTYHIWVDDTSGNHNVSADYTFEITPNNPPYIPSDPNPEDGATDVDIDADLSWNCSDPDPGDTLTYDVYFGDSSPPSQVASNLSATTYDPGTMNPNTQYYWMIVAWDNHGASTAGPIWDFTTENNPPYVPSNPDPYDGETGIDVNADLSWTGGDPDPGDTVTYDVYFGDSSPPPQASNNQSATTYNPGMMENDTTYYWQIVSWDNHGASTAGPIWEFTTGSGNISVTITLCAGWNLITIPVDNNYNASDLCGIIPGLQLVSRFDGVNQTFESYICGGPPGFDFPIICGHGYFVLVDDDCSFTVSGPPCDTVSVPLYIGWNMIGWFHDYDTWASSLAGNITGCEVVSWFDAVNQSFESYIVGGPPGFDFLITQGMGIMVLVNEESVWHGEG